MSSEQQGEAGTIASQVAELRQARYQAILEEARVVRQLFEWVGRDRLSIGANPGFAGDAAGGTCTSTTPRRFAGRSDTSRGTRSARASPRSAGSWSWGMESHSVNREAGPLAERVVRTRRASSIAKRKIRSKWGLAGPLADGVDPTLGPRTASYERVEQARPLNVRCVANGV